jgi:hypothetical protein
MIEQTYKRLCRGTWNLQPDISTIPIPFPRHFSAAETTMLLKLSDPCRAYCVPENYSTNGRRRQDKDSDLKGACARRAHTHKDDSKFTFIQWLMLTFCMHCITRNKLVQTYQDFSAGRKLSQLLKHCNQWICSRMFPSDMHLCLRWVLLATGIGMVSTQTQRKYQRLNLPPVKLNCKPQMAYLN